MTAHTETHVVRDIATGGNATLRLPLVEDGDAGLVLIASHGFGTGDDFHRDPPTAERRSGSPRACCPRYVLRSTTWRDQ